MTPVDYILRESKIAICGGPIHRLEILPCAGTYFLLADYSAISDLDDVAFCHWLTEHVGVAAIPLSVFCADPFPIN